MVVSPCRALRSADARALTSSASIGSLWSATSVHRLCGYSCTRSGAASQGWRPPGCDHRVGAVRPRSSSQWSQNNLNNINGLSFYHAIRWRLIFLALDYRSWNGLGYAANGYQGGRMSSAVNRHV